MAFDLFKGITKRNWARSPNQLLTIPIPSVTIEKPGEKALKEAKDLDSRVKVRPAAGRGAVISTKWKWG
jgi:hypothetical protein